MNITCPICGSDTYPRSDTIASYRCKNRECNKSFIPENVSDSTSRSRDDRKEPDFDQKAFEEHLKDRGIDESQVKSVKHWQSASGDFRWSIVTHNEEAINQDEFFDKLSNKMKEEMSPFFIHKREVDIPRGFFIWSSDKHVGAHTPDTSLYPNEYNEVVFKDRMFKLLDEIEYNFKIYGRFDKLFFIDLGDPLDGYQGKTARRGHDLPQNMTDEEQFDTYFGVHKDFFDNLVQMNVANNIHFEAVSQDNHSAAFGYCANRAVEIYLNVKYPNITTKITKKFIDHFSYGEHTFMYSHGKDPEDMKFGFPLELNDKTENLINDYIDARDLKGFKHFIKGDLHQSAEQYGKKFRYKNAMSMFGASKWIQHNYGNSMAGVNYEIIDKHNPKVNSMVHIF